jgi:RNA polymerase sigma-70 factor (ECF subfamily)
MRPADGETLTLIRRCQAGDLSAFGGIFERYKNLVYKTAYLMLGNARDAEDVLQEVFLEAYRVLGQYQPERAAFQTWLYRITINDCLNWKRKHRIPVLSLDEVNPAADSPNDDADREVWSAISKLSPKLRAVVVLRYYLDLSYLELAQALDIPLGTVKSRLNQALQVVRDDLKGVVERDLSPTHDERAFGWVRAK